jgi:phage tail-like protein
MRKGFAANGNGDGFFATNGDEPAGVDGAAVETYLSSGAVPIGSLLPSVYQEYDENALRLTSGLDGVLAPIWLSIDCYDAYLTPAMSPDDVTAWLATWVGIVADDVWRGDGLVGLVERAFELFRWRGTVKGTADLIEAYTGLRPQVEDNGGVAVSPTRGGGVLAGDRPAVVVRLPRQALGDDDATREAGRERLVALLDATTPAHVINRLELT